MVNMSTTSTNRILKRRTSGNPTRANRLGTLTSSLRPCRTSLWSPAARLDPPETVPLTMSASNCNGPAQCPGLTQIATVGQNVDVNSSRADLSLAPFGCRPQCHHGNIDLSIPQLAYQESGRLLSSTGSETVDDEHDPVGDDSQQGALLAKRFRSAHHRDRTSSLPDCHARPYDLGYDRPIVTTAPLVSVVVPARNSAGFLGEQLDALTAQRDVPFELIVVDSASPTRPRP